MIHQYAIGWIVGSGRNKREARAHAEQLAAAALQQSPLIIRRYRGHTAVIYQIAGNWSYRIIAADDGDSRLIIDPDDVIPGADLAATEARADNHLAQNGWRPQDGDAVPDIIQGEANRAAFQRWAQWQSYVAQALAAGLNAQEAWQAASYRQSERVWGAALPQAVHDYVTALP